MGRVVKVMLGVGLLVVAVSGGCTPSEKASGDAALTSTQAAKAGLTDEALAIEERTALLDAVWRDESLSVGARREQLKQAVWTTKNGAFVRMRALEILADDPSDVNQVDTRAMLALVLGPEPDRTFVEKVCGFVSQRGWQDMTPSLMRQLARPLASRQASERAEAEALRKLHPGRELEAVALEVFGMEDAPGLGEQAKDRNAKARASAWEVLSALDPSGQKRAALLDDPRIDGRGLESLRVMRKVLGGVPTTASEMQWLAQVLSGEARYQTWWAEVEQATAGADRAKLGPMQLRHAKVVRWAATHQPAWLQMDKESLAAEMTARLKGRRVYSRGELGGVFGRSSEMFAGSLKRMTGADVLSLLVLDDLLRGSAGLAGELAQQGVRDREDRTSEYGGNLMIEGTSVRARLFPPRATQRTSDNRFVASDEMINQGVLAIAQYHFHAQEVKNTQYAGPSEGDLEYARTSGRLCVVFTSVGEGVFNVDVYFGDGIGADLGEIR